MRPPKLRPFLFIAPVILVAGLVLRETGVLDLSACSTALQTSQTIHTSHSYQGTEEVSSFCYHLVLKQEGKVLGQHANDCDPHPPVELEAVLEPFQFTGNTWMPLRKRFTLSYVCQLRTVSPANGHEFSGKAEGTVQADIRGFCSRVNARKLAVEEVTGKLLPAFQERIEQ